MIDRRSFLAAPLLLACSRASSPPPAARSLDDFKPGDVLMWDWDGDRLVVKGGDGFGPSQLQWRYLMPHCGPVKLPVFWAGNVVIYELPIRCTVHAGGNVRMVDAQTGEPVPEVLSYNAVTQEVVRVWPIPAVYDPLAGGVATVREIRRLRITPKTKEN